MKSLVIPAIILSDVYGSFYRIVPRDWTREIDTSDSTRRASDASRHGGFTSELYRPARNSTLTGQNRA